METPQTEDLRLNGEGQQSPPSPPHPSDPPVSAEPSSNVALETERLEAEKVHLLYSRSAAPTLITLAIGAVLLALLLWPVVSHLRLLIWVILMEVIALTRWTVVRHYQ